MPVLTPARRKALTRFNKAFEKAASRLGRKSKLARVAAKSARTVPIRVFDRSVLEKKGSSVTMGSRNMKLVTVGNGPYPRVKAESIINMPSRHLFYGNKLSFNGVATLAHELSHSPRNVSRVAKKLKMNQTQAEEFLADITSAAILKEMGFSSRKIISHYSGRGIVYGRHFPGVIRSISRAASRKPLRVSVKPRGNMHVVPKARKKSSLIGNIVRIALGSPKSAKKGFNKYPVRRFTPTQVAKARKNPWAIKKARPVRRAPLLREKTRLRRR